ncbi:recombinase family protein [Bradyrhizobium valentinum]|uniref:recombinase family protein n=1 Tax=Bradyrhizobium valentinum TaxID=1518501 RepID=UPI003B82F734
MPHLPGIPKTHFKTRVRMHALAELFPFAELNGRSMLTPAKKNSMKKRVAICLRVSTSKDTESQLRELSAVAGRSGWEIWKVYEDAGISGAKGRHQRPGLDAMMRTMKRERARHGCDMVSGSARSIAHRPARHSPKPS